MQAATLKSANLTRIATLENIAVFRDFIAEICRSNGISEEITFALQLSADEACANIIQHGYQDMPIGKIGLDIEISPTEVRLQIHDTGRSFDSRDAPVPDINAPLEEREVGGVGIFLILSMMDSVNYESTLKGNTLTLIKKLT
ncbi:MAG: ATP-binding protein [Anaerolineales bacterium]